MILVSEMIFVGRRLNLTQEVNDLLRCEGVVNRQHSEEAETAALNAMASLKLAILDKCGVATHEDGLAIWFFLNNPDFSEPYRPYNGPLAYTKDALQRAYPHVWQLFAEA